ncbi:MAG: putative toxin-antitoxin system toxin component, PIN family [Nitrospinota bacterium]
MVLDTNVLIASFFGSVHRGSVHRGKGSAGLLRAWREGKVVLCVSRAVLAEYRAVLGNLRFLGKRKEELLAALEGDEGVVRVRARRHLQEVPDPGDNRLLECALAAGARYLITSDRALLALDGFRGLQVCTSGEFWRRWRKDAG